MYIQIGLLRRTLTLTLTLPSPRTRTTTSPAELQPAYQERSESQDDRKAAEDDVLDHRSLVLVLVLRGGGGKTKTKTGGL